MKTYIVLPFKDRNGKYKKALDQFIEPFMEYMNTNLEDYDICIVEQQDGLLASGENLFNLGRTTNIGFDILCKEASDDDIFIFHPVDILPISTDYKIDMTTKFCAESHSPDGRFYKAMGFKCGDYRIINGYSNNYWGWGLEDDDLFIRLEINKIDFQTKIDKFNILAIDGNDESHENHFMPLYNSNHVFLHELKINKDVTASGLKNLSYEILEKTTYKKIKKYIIK